MKILFVLTSHDELGTTGKKTGFWLEEFASPYYFLKDLGVDITLASPKGGRPPIDPKSNETDGDATLRFKNDPVAQEALNNTAKLSLMQEHDFDAVFYPGGHGPLWDLYADKYSIALIEAFINAEKPVAAVCHAPAVLLNARASDGEPLVKGKNVTGFSNDEEEAVGLATVVPYLLQNQLTALGANYQKTANWQPLAVTDGLIITGQNPASSEAVAKVLLQALS